MFTRIDNKKAVERCSPTNTFKQSYKSKNEISGAYSSRRQIQINNRLLDLYAGAVEARQALILW